MHIGNRIKELRKEKGYTQQEVAVLLGYKSRSTVNKAENSSKATLKTIEKYCSAFGVSVPFFMCWDENKIIKEQADRDFELIAMSEESKNYFLKLDKLNNFDKKIIFEMIDRLSNK